MEYLKTSAGAHKDVSIAFEKWFLKAVKKELPVVKVYDKIHELIDLQTVINPNIGIAFPPGISIGKIAAHDSAYLSDGRTIKKDDIVKIDIGIHCSGYIIDCAKTFDLGKKNNSLVEATRLATSTAIKEIGPDQNIADISALIQETICSFDGVVPVRGLGGHNIRPYIIHAGKLIPCVPSSGDKGTILAGEQYAIETFAALGEGKFADCHDVLDWPATHFMLKVNKGDKNDQPNDIKLIKEIYLKKKTLPFSIREVAGAQSPGYDSYGAMSFKRLTRIGKIGEFRPLICATNTSQHEHTIYITDLEEKKIVLSEGSFLN